MQTNELLLATILVLVLLTIAYFSNNRIICGLFLVAGVVTAISTIVVTSVDGVHGSEEPNFSEPNIDKFGHSATDDGCTPLGCAGMDFLQDFQDAKENRGHPRESVVLHMANCFCKPIEKANLRSCINDVMRERSISRRAAEKLVNSPEVQNQLKFMTRLGIISRVDEKSGATIGLELDGFSEWLRSNKAPHGVAIEYQGPHHYSNINNEPPNKWLQGRKNDQLKVDGLREKGIALIKVHYQIPDEELANFVKSRLYDLGVLRSCYLGADKQPLFHYIAENVYPEPSVQSAQDARPKRRVGPSGRVGTRRRNPVVSTRQN
jgi:hypothetical protein